MAHGAIKIQLNPKTYLIRDNNIPYEKKICDTLSKIKGRVEAEVSDNSFYRCITEKVRFASPNIYTNEVIFKVSAEDYKDAHTLEMFVKHPKIEGCYSVRSLAYGTKEEILATMQNENFNKSVLEKIEKISDRLSDI